MGNRRYQLNNGTVLDDRYVVLGVLGEGGFGITYEAENRYTDTRVAVKEFFCRDLMDRRTDESNEVYLLEEDMTEQFEKEKARFLKEARLLRDFSDEEGIVHVIDSFEGNGTAYIIMTFMDGSTLRSHIKSQGRLSAGTAFRQMKPLLRTLGKVHATGLIHRDISPDNIMISPQGDLGLIDFGAAHSYNKNTRTYAAICKNGYAAPEQYRSDGSAGPAADIYSLCATIYFCLTGADPVDSLQRILMDDLPSPSSLGVKIPPAAEQILMKGLSLKPEERYRSSAELLSAIDKIYPNEVDPKKKKRQKTLAFAAAALIVVALAGVLGFFHWRNNLPEYRFRNIDTEVIWLSSDALSEEDRQQVVPVVRERLEVFAGKNNYLWEEDGNDIRIEFPADLLLRDQDPDELCCQFLTRSGKIYLSAEQPSYNAIHEGQWQNTPVAQEGLASVESLRGQIPGADRERFSLPEDGDYGIVQITFTEAQAAGINAHYDDILTEAGRELYLFQDVTLDLDIYFGGTWFTVGDGKSIRCADDWTQEESCQRVFLYNQTHEATSKTLTVRAKPVVDWENTDSCLLPGKYQCNENELPASYHLFFYGANDSTPENNAAWVHDFIVFKNRLDALAVPYSIGTVPYDEGMIAVKTARDALTQYVVETLGLSQSHVELCSSTDTFGSISLNIQDTRAEDGQWVIPFDYEWSEERYAEWTTQYANAENGYYLRTNSSCAPVARVSWDTLYPHLKDNEVVLTELCFGGETTGLQTADYLLSYLQTAAKEAPVNNYSAYSIFCDDKDGCQGEDFSSLPEAIYPNQKERYEQFRRDLESEDVHVEYYSTANYPLADGKRAWVLGAPRLTFFYYDLDEENYIQVALQETRRLYETCIAGSPFNYIHLYFNRGVAGEEHFAQLGLSFSCSGFLSGSFHTGSFGTIIASDAESLKQEADALITQDPVLKQLLPDDWKGFDASVPQDP